MAHAIVITRASGNHAKVIDADSNRPLLAARCVAGSGGIEDVNGGGTGHGSTRAKGCARNPKNDGHANIAMHKHAECSLGHHGSFITKSGPGEFRVPEFWHRPTSESRPKVVRVLTAPAVGYLSTRYPWLTWLFAGLRNQRPVRPPGCRSNTP